MFGKEKRHFCLAVPICGQDNAVCLSFILPVCLLLCMALIFERALLSQRFTKLARPLALLLFGCLSHPTDIQKHEKTKQLFVKYFQHD